MNIYSLITNADSFAKAQRLGNQNKVTVTQCPLVTAMQMAKKHNVTLQFCTACVHANIGHASSTVKWADVKNEDEAVILAVQDCIDKFNKLTGKH